MIEFKSITIKNFMPFNGETTISLDKTGICAVIGQNQVDSGCKSNRSGKSSIAEAIHFVLTGATIKNVAVEDVINDKAGKECVVDITFSRSGSLFRLVRARKSKAFGTGLHIYADGTEVTPRTPSEQKSKVDEVLGISVEELVNSMFFTAATPKFIVSKDRKKVFEQLIRLDDFEGATLRAREKRKEIDVDLARHASYLKAHQENLDRAVSLLNAEKEKLEQFSTSSSAIIATKHDTDIQWKHVMDEVAESERRLRLLADIDRKIMAVQADLSGKLSQAVAVHDQQRLRIADAESKLAMAVADMDSKVAAIQDERGRSNLILAGLIDEHNKKTEANNAATLSNSARSGRLLSLSGQKAKRQKELDSVADTCDKCGQSLPPHAYQTVKANISAAIAQLQEEISSIEAIPVVERIDLSALAMTMSDVKTRIAELDSIESRLKASVSSCEQVLRSHKEAAMSDTDYAAAKAWLEAKATELDTYQRTKKEIMPIYSQEQINDLRSQKQSYDHQMKTLLETEERMKKAVASAEAAIIPIKDSMVMAEMAMDQIRPGWEAYAYWEKNMREIRSLLFRDVIPFFNQQLAIQCATIAGEGFLMEFDENLEPTENCINYSRDSRGCQQRLDLCCQAAMMSVREARSGLLSNLMIFDEWAESLDEQGMDGFMRMVKSISQKVPNIMVTTHQQYLLDQFDRKMVVTKTASGSTIEVQ